MAFLSIKQAAEQFGTSVHTLRAVAKSGRLPGARKIGGQWISACTRSGATLKVGGISAASSTPKRPEVPAPM